MKTIATKIVIPGWHFWAAAPPSHSYLACSHRHLFHVEAEVRVEDSDREVEFFDLQQHIFSVLPTGLESPPGVGLSCEAIAELIHRGLTQGYAYNVHRVSVSEDGESTGTFYAS